MVMIISAGYGGLITQLQLSHHILVVCHKGCFNKNWWWANNNITIVLSLSDCGYRITICQYSVVGIEWLRSVILSSNC